MRWRLSLMGFDCKPTGNVRRITDKIDDEIGLKRRSVQSQAKNLIFPLDE
jgi:hypothetical protein